MDIAKQFGIEGKLLLTQLINFAILTFVFWKWVLPKVKGMLDERKAEIAKSLKEAEQARSEKEAADAEREQVLTEAKSEAERIVTDAKEQAETERVRLADEARTEAERIRQQANEQLATERETMRAELRAEISALTIASTRKVLSEVVGPAERERLTKAAMQKLKTSKRGARGK